MKIIKFNQIIKKYNQKVHISSYKKYDKKYSNLH